MIKTYESALLEIVMFNQTEVIVASNIDTPDTSIPYVSESDETEILRP